MGRKQNRYTQEQVLTAIKESGGIMATIADRLGCSWSTARKCVYKWNATKEAVDDEEQRTLDKAEHTLLKAIKDGDVQTCKWYLSTKGRARGYGDSLQVSSAANEPLTITIKDGPSESPAE